MCNKLHCELNELVNLTIRDRVILYTTNEETLKLNESRLDLLPGQQFMYFTSDDIVLDDDDECSQYPIEFLNSLTSSGMPPH